MKERTIPDEIQEIYKEMTHLAIEKDDMTLYERFLEFQDYYKTEVIKRSALDAPQGEYWNDLLKRAEYAKEQVLCYANSLEDKIE